MNRDEAIPPVLSPAVVISSPGLIGDLMALTKARLSALVLVTTAVGFLMGSGEIDWFLFVRTLFGTALVTASAAILNQYMESYADRLMARTRDRPLPSGRMQPGTALGLGVLLAVAGSIYMANRVNTLAALLAGLTLAVYLLAYTPLKRRSSICVAVGAVSGAIPPMIGWAAAAQSLDPGAWVLFGVLFLWQFPHFLAIAWIYRDDYSGAGFVMLRRHDADGVKTAREALLATFGLLGVSSLPLLLGLVTPIYLVGVVCSGALILWCAIQFLLRRSRETARRLFFASIIFLPVLLAVMVLTRK